MDNIVFQAKVVSTNKRTLTAAILTACGILPIVIFLSIPSLSKYVFFVFVAIIIFVILWVLLNKGSESIYDLKKNLIVYDDHLEIENLVFHFEAFRDMRPGCYEPSSEAELQDVHNGKDVFGLENTIAFKYKKQTFKYDFYVENQAHFVQFVQMLEFLYQSHINFKEENWYGKTFLMQNVNAVDYNNLLAKY